MARGRCIAALLVAIFVAPALAIAGSGSAQEWGHVLTPSLSPARVIGGPGNGCLAGAARLPPDGVGYQAVRLSRHRNYGHPETVGFVERLGKAAAAAGLVPFYVGDMAQPRG